jgi:hypothetical protein
VSAPWRRRDNNAETCRSYVKLCMHKLQNSALAGVIYELYCNALRQMHLQLRHKSVKD